MRKFRIIVVFSITMLKKSILVKIEKDIIEEKELILLRKAKNMFMCLYKSLPMMRIFCTGNIRGEDVKNV